MSAPGHQVGKGQVWGLNLALTLSFVTTAKPCLAKPQSARGLLSLGSLGGPAPASHSPQGPGRV